MLGSASPRALRRGDAGLSVFFVLDPLVFLGIRSPESRNRTR